MIIGLDIDDVIFKTSDAIRELFSNNTIDEEILAHKLDIMRGDPVNERITQFFNDNLYETLKLAKPFEEASKYIKLLRAQSHKIVLITARGDALFPGSEEITENALKEYNIEYDKIIYNASNKSQLCEENNIELFVDDSPQNCIEVMNNLHIPVIGFESDITRDELRKNNIQTVNNWNDLITLINKISKQV